MEKTERGCRINHRVLRSIDDFSLSLSPPSYRAPGGGAERGGVGFMEDSGKDVKRTAQCFGQEAVRRRNTDARDREPFEMGKRDAG